MKKHQRFKKRKQTNNNNNNIRKPKRNQTNKKPQPNKTLAEELSLVELGTESRHTNSQPSWVLDNLI